MQILSRGTVPLLFIDGMRHTAGELSWSGKANSISWHSPFTIDGMRQTAGELSWGGTALFLLSHTAHKYGA